MRIGIDISQLAFENTGVATFLKNLVEKLISEDRENEYFLFFSSLRRNFKFSILNFKSTPKNLKIKTFKLPPSLLDFIWNKLHIIPIEWFIGPVDVFISSDWTEPPTIKAKKITILYDLVVYKYPNETAKKIVDVQKRKLKWTKKECDKIICISESTKKDAQELLGINEARLRVVYPGI